MRKIKTKLRPSWAQTVSLDMSHQQCQSLRWSPRNWDYKIGTVPNPANGKTTSYQTGGSVNNTNMCIEGTNQRYNGMTLEVGGAHYTTKGGTLEGNSRKLIPCR